MLKHIVMWKLEEFAEGKSKAENARWMKEHLEALVGVIPQIKSLEVGINVNKSDAAYDAVLVSTFENEADLSTYQTHPEHVKVSTYCNKIRISRVVADYYTEETSCGR